MLSGSSNGTEGLHVEAQHAETYNIVCNTSSAARSWHINCNQVSHEMHSFPTLGIALECSRVFTSNEQTGERVSFYADHCMPYSDRAKEDGSFHVRNQMVSQESKTTRNRGLRRSSRLALPTGGASRYSLSHVLTAWVYASLLSLLHRLAVKISKNLDLNRLHVMHESEYMMAPPVLSFQHE